MLVKVIQFLPAIVFFAAFKLTNNLVMATAVIVGACIICSALEYILTKHISKIQIFMLAAVILFGVPTVLLNDPDIIKWKVTVINLILASSLFISQEVFKKLPFKYFLGDQIKLPDEAFRTFARMWMVFFVFASIINIIIAFYLPFLFNVSEDEALEWWVDYKAFGNPILNAFFAVICGFILIRKYPEAFNEINQDKK